MKCFTISSNCLDKFNIWSVEFFNLLKKQEYDEILKLSVKEIKQKIKDLNLSKEELENIKENVYNKGILREKGLRGFSLDLLKESKESEIYKNYVFLIGGLRIYLKQLKENLKKEKELIKKSENFIKRF